MTKVADQQPKYIKVMIYLCFRDKSFKSLSHKLKTDGNVQLQTDQERSFKHIVFESNSGEMSLSQWVKIAYMKVIVLYYFLK